MSQCRRYRTRFSMGSGSGLFFFFMVNVGHRPLEFPVATDSPQTYRDPSRGTTIAPKYGTFVVRPDTPPRAQSLFTLTLYLRAASLRLGVCDALERPDVKEKTRHLHIKCWSTPASTPLFPSLDTPGPSPTSPRTGMRKRTDGTSVPGSQSASCPGGSEGSPTHTGTLTG